MVSIFLEINCSYWLCVYIIQNLLKNSSGAEIELFIVLNTKDEKTKEYLSKIIESKKYSNLISLYFTENNNVNLLKEAKGDYICIYKDNIIVNDNWLVDLLYYNYNIIDSGIVSIYNNNNKGKFTPMLSINDTFINVWKKNDNLIDGIVLVKKELLKLSDNESIELALLKITKENFYIPSQNSIKLK